MKRSIWLPAAVGMILLAQVAAAQFPNTYKTNQWGQPSVKPAVSPYVGLLRPGASPAFNYITQVQPQLQFQQGFQGLQGQVNTVQQTVGTLEQQPAQASPLLPATGHSVGFLTHKSYFMNPGGPGGGYVDGTGNFAIGTGVAGLGNAQTKSGVGTAQKKR